MLQLGSETHLKALGKTWTVGRLELRLIRDFKEWVKARLPDPLTALPERIFNALPLEEQVKRYKEAEDHARQLAGFSLECPIARAALATAEGAGEFARLLLSQHHPDVTADEAFAVMTEAGPRWAASLETASGKVPAGNAGAEAATPPL